MRRIPSSVRRGTPTTITDELASAFRRSVDEGAHRLGRSWPSLLATGAVGGVDVSVGVLALLLVEQATGSALLAGLAFGIGFIALTLANSELFTENFLVPVMAVVAGKAGPLDILRLWLGTALTNLLAGWVVMGVVVAGVPEVRGAAVDVAKHYVELGAGQAFAAAVLGGAVITLMTWMERGTDSVPAKLVAAVSAAFLLIGGKLNHVIVVSLLIFGALHAGAPYGYADWLRVVGWATAGNLVGGLGLVTMLRLVQVGQQRLLEEREDNAGPDDFQPAHGGDARGGTRGRALTKHGRGEGRPEVSPNDVPARPQGIDRYDGAMGVFDKAKDLTDKVEDVTEENVDKLGGLIDKAADKINEKTGGKYSDKIDPVAEAIQNPVDATAGTEEPPERPAP